MRAFQLKFWPILLVGFLLIKAPFLAPIIDVFCLFLAKSTTSVLQLFDSQIMRHEAIIYHRTFGYAIEVTKECSALLLLTVFFSAVLAFPTSLLNRLKGLLFAIMITQSINFIRLMSLVYLQAGLTLHHFELAHEKVWPYLLTIILSIAFTLWSYRQSMSDQGLKFESSQ